VSSMGGYRFCIVPCAMRVFRVLVREFRACVSIALWVGERLRGF